MVILAAVEEQGKGNETKQNSHSRTKKQKIFNFRVSRSIQLQQRKGGGIFKGNFWGEKRRKIKQWVLSGEVNLFGWNLRGSYPHLSTTHLVIGGNWGCPARNRFSQRTPRGLSYF